MVIFHCYVSSPEGNPNGPKQQDLRLVGTWPRGCRAVRKGPLDGGATGRSEAHHGLKTWRHWALGRHHFPQ